MGNKLLGIIAFFLLSSPALAMNWKDCLSMLRAVVNPGHAREQKALLELKKENEEWRRKLDLYRAASASIAGKNSTRLLEVLDEGAPLTFRGEVGLLEVALLSENLEAVKILLGRGERLSSVPRELVETLEKFATTPEIASGIRRLQQEAAADYKAWMVQLASNYLERPSIGAGALEDYALMMIKYRELEVLKRILEKAKEVFQGKFLTAKRSARLIEEAIKSNDREALQMIVVDGSGRIGRAALNCLSASSSNELREDVLKFLEIQEEIDRQAQRIEIDKDVTQARAIIEGSVISGIGERNRLAYLMIHHGEYDLLKQLLDMRTDDIVFRSGGIFPGYNLVNTAIQTKNMRALTILLEAGAPDPLTDKTTLKLLAETTDPELIELIRKYRESILRRQVDQNSVAGTH